MLGYALNITGLCTNCIPTEIHVYCHELVQAKSLNTEVEH